jgi:hypothetical protein
MGTNPSKSKKKKDLDGSAHASSPPKKPELVAGKSYKLVIV